MQAAQWLLVFFLTSKQTQWLRVFVQAAKGNINAKFVGLNFGAFYSPLGTVRSKWRTYFVCAKRKHSASRRMSLPPPSKENETKRLLVAINVSIRTTVQQAVISYYGIERWIGDIASHSDTFRE